VRTNQYKIRHHFLLIRAGKREGRSGPTLTFHRWHCWGASRRANACDGVQHEPITAASCEGRRYQKKRDWGISSSRPQQDHTAMFLSSRDDPIAIASVG
jgi:hypothetical protein